MTAVRERRVVVPHRVRLSRFQQGRVLRRLHGETMGTTWSVLFVAPPDLSSETLTEAVSDALDNIVSEMSAWEPQSHLSRFNRAEAGSILTLPAALFHVLHGAIAVAAETGGAYDPTIGALVNLWGFGPEARATCPPNAAAIAIAKAACGWSRLVLQQRTAVQPGGLVLDLCAIAKGFAVDRVCDVVREQGCTDFLVEIGGELRGEGRKPDGTPWWVAVEPPRSEAGVPDTVIALHGLAVATSGDHRRYFEHGGRRYGHTIDPRTGYPVSNGVMAVTVLADTCMAADAFSTALYTMGKDDGLSFAAQRGMVALFVWDDDGRLRQSASPAFEAMAA